MTLTFLPFELDFDEMGEGVVHIGRGIPQNMNVSDLHVYHLSKKKRIIIDVTYHISLMGMLCLGKYM